MVRDVHQWSAVKIAANRSDGQSIVGAPDPPSPESAPDRGALDSVAATATSRPVDAGGTTATSFAISNWAVARYTLIALSVIGGLYLLWRIQEVLFLLLLAILFATAIEPLVNRLRQGPFSRGQGVLIVYSLIFLTISAIGFLFVPGLVDQATRFVDTLPQQIGALRPRFEAVEPRIARETLLRLLGEAQPAVQSALEQPHTPTEPQQLVEAGGAFAHSLFGVVTVFLLAYYWLTERPMIKRAVLRLVPPSRARQVNVTWLHVEARLGGWVRGQLLVMLALGIMACIAFVLLGLPNPVLLAVLAGLCEIIPMVGPFLAFLPALLVAITVDPAKALILIPIALVIQQIEGNVLIPRVMSHSVGVSPLTVVVGILIGSILYGPAGAFLAVPVAAAIQVILSDTLGPAIEEDTGRVPVPEAELEGERPVAIARV
jgi:predicted PurR-regulated permease PerM